MEVPNQNNPTSLEISLPLPPALNHAFRSAVTRGGRPYSYKSSAAKKWQEVAWLLIRRVWKYPPLNPPIVVDVFIDPKHDRDVDSSAKLLLDTLQEAGVYQNDMKIVSLHLHKTLDRKTANKSDTIDVFVSSLESKSIKTITNRLMDWIQELIRYVASLGATPKKSS